jgi:hypothetical protein
MSVNQLAAQPFQIDLIPALLHKLPQFCDPIYSCNTGRSLDRVWPEYSDQLK